MSTTRSDMDGDLHANCGAQQHSQHQMNQHFRDQPGCINGDDLSGESATSILSHSHIKEKISAHEGKMKTVLSYYGLLQQRASSTDSRSRAHEADGGNNIYSAAEKNAQNKNESRHIFETSCAMLEAHEKMSCADQQSDQKKKTK